MITDHQTVVDGYTIYYRTAGDPIKQHLILFNGWGARLTGPLRSDRVIEALAKHFYVVSPELPGFMRSDPPREVWKIEDFVHIAHKVLAPLHLTSPIVMGQSFGGGIAALYTKLYGQNTPCLILVDALLASRRENWYFKLRYTLPHLIRVIGAIPFSPLQRMLWCLYLGVPRSLFKKRGIDAYSNIPRFQVSPHYRPEVDYLALGIPLLLVWGNRDTWVTNITEAKLLHEKVPNSRFVMVRGPHTILYRKPAYVIGEILKALHEMAIVRFLEDGYVNKKS